MKFIFFILFCVPVSFACEVSMPQRLVVLSDEISGQSPLNFQNCSTEAMDDFHRTLIGMEGKISAEQMSEILSGKGHLVQLNQTMIQVQHLKSFIRDQLIVPAGVHVKTTHSVNNSNFMTLAPGDQLQISCSSCLWGTRQPLNVSISGFDGTRKDFIAIADFGRMVRAFRLIKPMNSFSDVTVYDIKEEFTEAVPHTDYISEVQNLKYYKTNKPIKSGEFLKVADLNALNIVRAGLKTEVILESAMIRIKTSGISRGNGAFGDFVEVYHPQKNKKYQGKVIDNNKVLVEL